MPSEDHVQREGRRGGAQLQKGTRKPQAGKTPGEPQLSSKESHSWSVSVFTLASPLASQPPPRQVPQTCLSSFIQHLLGGCQVAGLR